MRDLEREANRYVERVRDIAPYDQILAAVWRAWNYPKPSSNADQLEQAAEFDRLNPPTVAWHEALIDALKNVEGLSDETRAYLIQQHLDAIAALKGNTDAS